jgi:CPA2 family monovalent cation:H+ antiporter-2
VADGASFLLDLALVTGLAGLTTLVFHHFKQPVLVGYLLAGVVVGPHSPGIQLQTIESVNALAELGIVFLMFSIGLEFRLRRLWRAGAGALGAALVGIAGVIAITLFAGRVLGWSTQDALFMGAILAISSTVIAAKAMAERGHLGQRWAEIAMGVLIVQDVAAVAILAILGTSGAESFGFVELLSVLGRLATFAMAALVLGLLVVPRIVNRLARERADEVLVVTLAGLALATAVLALQLGFSPALGAFLMGAVVGEASESWSAAQRIQPLRDLFTAVFFVSIGMLLDPALLAQHWRAALALGALMVGAKLALHTLPAFLLGSKPRDAFKASLALAQIGEFSFVIAALGLTLGAVSGFVLPVTVAIAMASALWTPYLLRHGDALYDALAPRAPAALRGWAGHYDAWRQRRAALPERWPAEVRRDASKLLLNAGATGLILLATAAGSRAVAATVSVRGLTDRSVALLPWVAGGVLALPFAFTAARAGWALAARATGRKRAARAGLLAATAALGVFAGLLAAAPFLPPLPLLLLSFAAFLGAAIVLWEAMARFHGRVEHALEQALGGEAQGDERQQVLDALRHEYRWGAEVERARVEPGTLAGGITVRALELRARTGATLMAVQRAGHTIVNPGPGFILAPGDALLVLGDVGQLERARELLRQPAMALHTHEAAPRIAEVPIEQGSALAGATIAESALRERTGATVVGILREGQRLPNPGAHTRLQAGDVLLVVGAEEEVRGAAQLARSGQAGAARGGGAAGPGSEPQA